MELTKQDCMDILTIALEGGYMNLIPTSVKRNADSYVEEMRLEDEEDGAEYQITWEDVPAAVKKLLSQAKPGSYIGKQLKLPIDVCQVDAIGADAVIQVHCLGEVVYG